MKQFILLLVSAFLLISGNNFAQSNIEEEHEGDPRDRAKFFYDQRAYPFDSIPSDALFKAREQQRRFFSTKKNGAQLLAQQPIWRQAGPTDVGGRTRTIVHHPTKDGWVYVGTANGGVWRTTNGGGNWEPIMDHENSISMGALALDPNNPDVLYAATGEYASGNYGYSGAGIYKSVDGGTTWNLHGLATVGGFSKIYVHPKNSDVIYAGAVYGGGGFYKSVNAGVTWKRTIKESVSDVSINPNNINELFIGTVGSGIFYSQDGGETWTPKTIPLFNAGRISVQQSNSKPNVVYALVDVGGINGGAGMGHILVSNDRGDTWEDMYSDISIFNTNDQGGYDNFITVHPTNANIALAGGVNLFQTTDGGNSWNNVAGYRFSNTHPDTHCGCFNPLNPNIVYMGCDGGMYKSEDAGSSWSSINTGLAVTQFQGNFAMDQSKPAAMYGGAQDNGTMSNTAKGFGELLGGDGAFVAINPNNQNIIYAETQNAGNMVRLDLKLNSFSPMASISDPGAFVAPLIYDPATEGLYSGRSALYASYNQGSTWSQFSPALKAKISAIAVSQPNPDIFYIGSQRGELLISKNGGGRDEKNWTAINNNGLPNRFVSDIEPSLVNPNTAYVTLSGFNSAHVFKTVDAGSSWIDIGKNLPDVPTNCIAIHPNDENILFVGTDIGVYSTYDGGKSWFPLGTGFPSTAIIDMQFYLGPPTQPGTLKLRVSTHGRSMWEVDVPTEIISSYEITAPVGGEQFVTGSSQHISWYGFTSPVNVEYSIDNGTKWTLIASNAIGSSLQWTIPNRSSEYARIRITSATNASEVRISRTFSIVPIKIGTILGSGSVAHAPYGLAYDGKNGLWTTSFYEAKMYKLNATTLIIEKEVNFEDTKDSLGTDLAIDPKTGTIYLHKLNSTSSDGGMIYVMDTNGVISKKFKSPSSSYPVGLKLVDGKLIAGDRDGARLFSTVDPSTGATLAQVKNPYQVANGPRCLAYDGNQFLYQTCYNLPSAAYCIKIDKNDLTKEVARMELLHGSSPINARGIEYDPGDKNFWVADAFSGIIYKVAGFETVTPPDAVDEPINEQLNEVISGSIYPNPTADAAFISYQVNKPASHLKIEVVNLLGETIGTLFDNTISGNEQNILRLETSNMTSGVYSIVFTVDKMQRVAKKLIIAH